MGGESSSLHTEKYVRQIAIMGLGLMGGSLGLALKHLKVPPRLVGYARRDETRKVALTRGVVDAVHDRPESAVKDADLVVFCLPVLAIPAVLKQCLPALKPGCVITDVASTKAELCTQIARLLADTAATFVGSHPMAGSEKTGLAAARADLYQGAVVILTPEQSQGEETSNHNLALVRTLWERVGARCVVMPAEMHDRVVARTSHLPHLLAAALVEYVLCQDDAIVHQLCGSGFRDTTRIAGGSEIIWHDVLRTNAGPILAELDGYIRLLLDLRTKLAAQDFEGLKEFLARVRRLRDELNPKHL
ncbi:MAG: prephenate dehydrogenase [Kiritimatiellia bacterium]